MTKKFHQTFVLWPLRLMAISVVVVVGTYWLVSASKVFVAAAVIFGVLHSLSTMEELTGGRELTWLSIPLVLVGDGFLTLWAFAGITFLQKSVLFVQFLAIVIISESLIVFMLRAQLQAFSEQRNLKESTPMSNKRLERTRR